MRANGGARGSRRDVLAAAALIAALGAGAAQAATPGARFAPEDAAPAAWFAPDAAPDSDTTAVLMEEAPADTAWNSDSLAYIPTEGEGPAPPESPAEKVFYQPDASYDRVNGWVLGVRYGCRPSGWYPSFDVRLGVATHRHARGLYVLDFAQPVLPGRRLLLGWQVRRTSDGHHGDEDRVGRVENFLSSLFFRYDYRDYVERAGMTYSAILAPWPWLTATAAFSNLSHRSLADPAPTPKTLFRRDSPWRPNPPSVEGRMRMASAEIVVDRVDNPSAPPRRGMWGRLAVDATGPRLDSDFTFTRYEGEVRGWWPLTVGMDVKGRLLAGSVGAGALPIQEEFAIGGISTLRGLPYKKDRGDRLLLANLEYELQLWRGRQRSGVRTDVRLLAFGDVGQAWRSTSFDPARRRFDADAGLGLGVADGRLRLYAARDLHDSGAPILWTLRLSSPF